MAECNNLGSSSVFEGAKLCEISYNLCSDKVRHDGRGNRDEGVRRAEEDGDECDEESALAHAGERRIGKASGELRAEEIPRDHARAHDRHDEAHG